MRVGGPSADSTKGGFAWRVSWYRGPCAYPLLRRGHIGDLYPMVEKGDTPISVDYASLTHAEDVLGRGISLR